MRFPELYIVDNLNEKPKIEDLIIELKSSLRGGKNSRQALNLSLTRLGDSGVTEININNKHINPYTPTLRANKGEYSMAAGPLKQHMM